MPAAQPTSGDVIVLDDGSMVGIEKAVLGDDQGVWSVADGLGRRWLVRPWPAMDNKIAAQFGPRSFHCWQPLPLGPEAGS
jgi:hypothetical protein